MNAGKHSINRVFHTFDQYYMYHIEYKMMYDNCEVQCVLISGILVGFRNLKSKLAKSVQRGGLKERIKQIAER